MPIIISNVKSKVFVFMFFYLNLYNPFLVKLKLNFAVFLNENLQKLSNIYTAKKLLSKHSN